MVAPEGALGKAGKPRARDALSKLGDGVMVPGTGIEPVRPEAERF